MMDVSFWSCDESAKSRFGFDWWWVLLFLKDPNPRHAMVVWSHRASPAKINGLPYMPSLPVREGDETSAPMLASGWSYAGGQMNVPLMLQVYDARMRKDNVEYSKGGLLKKEDGGFRFTVNGDKEKYDLKMTPWNGEWKNQTVVEKIGHGFIVLYSKSLKTEGTVTINGKTMQVSGSANLQKVTTNVPLPPWYWGIAHGSGDNYVDYFFPYLGAALLQRHDKLTTTCDRTRLLLRRSFGFRHRESNTAVQFENARIKITPHEETPAYTITAQRGREHAKAVFQTLGRARFLIESRRPFFYNGFPAELVDFEYNNDGEKVVLADLGGVQASCEHAWGVVL
ncbi:Uncharacterised protein [uncultured archaeon]|nr:Uncharacterised protein [uncultured archaeon]